GVTDLVEATQNSSGQLQSKAWLNRFRPPTIKHFPNGLAQPSEVTYAVITTALAQTAPANGIATYSDTAAAPAAGTMFYMTPMRVVASIAAEDGTATGTMFTTDYQYSRLRASTAGRGPQGFQLIRAIDNRHVTDADILSRKVTETTYAQVYPYTGMPLRVVRYVNIGGAPPSGAQAVL